MKRGSVYFSLGQCSLLLLSLKRGFTIVVLGQQSFTRSPGWRPTPVSFTREESHSERVRIMVDSCEKHFEKHTPVFLLQKKNNSEIDFCRTRGSTRRCHLCMPWTPASPSGTQALYHTVQVTKESHSHPLGHFVSALPSDAALLSVLTAIMSCEQLTPPRCSVIRDASVRCILQVILEFFHFFPGAH